MVRQQEGLLHSSVDNFLIALIRFQRKGSCSNIHLSSTLEDVLYTVLGQGDREVAALGVGCPGDAVGLWQPQNDVIERGYSFLDMI